MKPTYIFGYGSLVVPFMIQRDGMSIEYAADSVEKLLTHDVLLKGFRRNLSVYMMNGLYYGITENKKDQIYGALLKIQTNGDWYALMASEGRSIEFIEKYGYALYKLYNVTNRIDFKKYNLEKDASVYTLVTNPQKIPKKAKAHRRYIQLIAEYLRTRLGQQKFEELYSDIAMDYKNLQ